MQGQVDRLIKQAEFTKITGHGRTSTHNHVKARTPGFPIPLTYSNGFVAQIG